MSFLYEWDPTKTSDKMLNIKDVIIIEKWKIASKGFRTGTTHHIGSITNIDKLK